MKHQEWQDKFYHSIAEQISYAHAWLFCDVCFDYYSKDLQKVARGEFFAGRKLPSSSFILVKINTTTLKSIRAMGLVWQVGLEVVPKKEAVKLYKRITYRVSDYTSAWCMGTHYLYMQLYFYAHDFAL